jgi:hypothetical protein
MPLPLLLPLWGRVRFETSLPLIGLGKAPVVTRRDNPDTQHQVKVGVEHA